MAVIRLETNKDNTQIIIKRLNYDRFAFHGFGSFIWKLKPEEISISQEALDLIKTRVGRTYTSMGDLAGLDLNFNTVAADPRQHGFILSYGALAPKLRVPIEDVLIDYESFENLKKATLESKSPNFDPVDLKLWIDMLKSRNEKTQEEIINKYYQKENY